MPGKMAYLAYQSDDGETYAIKTRARYVSALNSTVGGTAALGFAPYTPGQQLMPRGMTPRGVYLSDPTGGATRFVPVGSTDAPAWTGSVTTVQCDYSGIGTLTDMKIVGRRKEGLARQAHEVANLSDAS